MDDNVLKQFEGMPTVANNADASVPPAASVPAAESIPAVTPTPPVAPVEVHEFPQIAQTPRVVRPAPSAQRPTAHTKAEFKAIVPDPIFARTGVKTLQQDVQENSENVVLETLGRNTAPTMRPPTHTPPATPTPAPAPAPTSIAQPFSSILRESSVPAGPTAASAFRAATAAPQPAPLTPRAAQTLSESQFARPTFAAQDSAIPSDPNAIESLRTYERDVAQSIRGGETVMSINRAAQQKNEARQRERREMSEATEIVARNSLKTIVSLVLVVGAIATLGIVFFVSRQNAPVPQVAIERTIISVDNTREIKLSVVNRAGIISAAQNALKNTDGAPVTAQSLTRVKMLDSGIADLGTAREISANTFLSAVATKIPAALIRAFGNEWLFGFHAQKKNEPFLIIDISSFDNAYSGMLRWEADMPTDLGNIFLVNNVTLTAADTGTTTATSTKPVTSGATTTTPSTPVAEKMIPIQIPLKQQFEDVVVKSRDTRVLKNAQGNVALLYSFIDTKYVVITTNEDTFREIIDRYLASGLVR